MEGTGRRSDHDLVRRFDAGDREAFLTLYRAHSPAVFRYALYMTNDRPRAEELTQDVFVWLVRHAGDWDPELGDLPAFLGGVARKFLQRQQRIERRWTSLEAHAASAAEFVGNVERAQEAASLHRAIAALPARYREAVVLCDLQGKTYDEAAAIQECPVGTVRSRLHRARQLLARKFLDKRERVRCT